MHTFQVTDQPLPTKPPYWTSYGDPLPVGESVLAKGASLICGEGAPVYRRHRNAWFLALSTAFNQHFPLVITPDAAWLTIVNGLTHHIDNDPEGLRHHFVQHEGKEELKVWVPNLEPESVSNAVHTGFAPQLREHIGKKHDLIVCDFSTTKPIDRISSEVMLMGAMKHYFDYKMMLLCNLTQVTIEGTVEDWENIETRVRALSEFDLEWWTAHLLPVIDQFKSACAGSPDLDFWKRMFKHHGFGSGSQGGMTGWLNAWFPYISGGKKSVRNPAVDWQLGQQTDEDDLHNSLSKVPITIDDNGYEYKATFYAGATGVTVDPVSYALTPVSGWALIKDAR